VDAGGGEAIVTSYDAIESALSGRAGTHVTRDARRVPARPVSLAATASGSTS